MWAENAKEEERIYKEKPGNELSLTIIIIIIIIIITKFLGTRWRRWLRHCATCRKVVGSIPDGVNGIF